MLLYGFVFADLFEAYNKVSRLFRPTLVASWQNERGMIQNDHVVPQGYTKTLRLRLL